MRRVPLLLLLVAVSAQEHGERRTWGVYLTAASKKQDGRYRRLELNWYGLPSHLQDVASVHLFNTDPHVAARNVSFNPLESYQVTGRDGRRTTSVGVPSLQLD
ncbi:hypothetical protein HPB51_011974 [Rhipicephalus microplus]|uniref:Uncharacterized protein n=1 Tax=Rhipicephalus microplus TaxID=6941 RepID=A0A9J6F1Z4_RHIMP|nr:hypothetical protein HPB51_011974 [Rhipicephalus microplus]